MKFKSKKSNTNHPRAVSIFHLKGLYYQLKSIRRDKLCILTFLLPVIAGIALQLLSGFQFSSLGETAFGAVRNELTAETTARLRQLGTLTEYETADTLTAAVLDPATQLIGIRPAHVPESSSQNMSTAAHVTEPASPAIRTLLSGDELTLTRTIAEALPQTLHSLDTSLPAEILPPPSSDTFRSLLSVIALVTAMFMGCVFNALSITGEKEDGIHLINRILPLTPAAYLIQKLAIGFAGGLFSTVLTALVCLRLSPSMLLPFAAVLLLSSYTASLAGLYIGQFAQGMMTGIVYIKIFLIFFLAPPILVYLTVPSDSPWFYLPCLLPSGPAFYSLMDMMSGKTDGNFLHILVLAVHAILWSAAFPTLLKKYLYQTFSG